MYGYYFNIDELGKIIVLIGFCGFFLNIIKGIKVV